MARLVALGLALALAACAGGKDSAPKSSRTATAAPPAVSSHGPSRYKVGRPYVIAGKRHYPSERFVHTETGRASWYGPGFHGKRTANGERFDQRAMTAAHRTLQMPSIVRATNIGNGRSVVLRVNDRGPYHGGRVLDVSEAAAEALNFKHLGTAIVRIDVLEQPSREAARLAQEGASVAELEALRARAAARPVTSPSPPPPTVVASATPPRPAPPPSEQAYVQAGAFAEIDNARKLAARAAPYGEAEILPLFTGDKRLYRVRLGPYPDIAAAGRAVAQLAEVGVARAHVVVIR